MRANLKKTMLLLAFFGIAVSGFYGCGGELPAGTKKESGSVPDEAAPGNQKEEEEEAISPGGEKPYEESIKVEDMENLQYLGIHRGDWTLGSPWDMGDPSSFDQAGMDEILEAVGTRGTSARRLAISYTFSYLKYPAESIAGCVANMLALSEKNDIPVILHLDGVNWWDNRPDLWNFWDENAPGYDPGNIKNVERYNWEMDAAVKIGWRNWGMQIRVPPAPNLASAEFLAAQEEALDVILPVIAKWHGELPPEKKYLLGGVVFGWEISPYVQAYFFEGGNELLGEPAKNDPQLGGLVNNSSLWNTMALGYAAAEKLGIQSESAITEETMDKVCSFYLNFLIEAALRHGIDPKRIITHSFWGGATKTGGGQSGAASISSVEGVIPGWSWYDADFKGIEKVAEMANGKPWAAIEVRSWNLGSKQLKNLFALKNNRYVNIFNWEGLRDDKDFAKVFGIIRDVLEE